jgi:hypothetical protein
MLQAFSADLQAMLTQMLDSANASAASGGATTTPTGTTAGGSTTTTANTSASTSTGSGADSSTSATATSATQTASVAPQAADGTHPYHHHHHFEGNGQSGDPLQTAVNQAAGTIDRMAQSGSLSAGSISNTASGIAGDIMQALQAYGSVSATGAPVAMA